jgi:hypothetical protein
MFFKAKSVLYHAGSKTESAPPEDMVVVVAVGDCSGEEEGDNFGEGFDGDDISVGEVRGELVEFSGVPTDSVDLRGGARGGEVIVVVEVVVVGDESVGDDSVGWLLSLEFDLGGDIALKVSDLTLELEAACMKVLVEDLGRGGDWDLARAKLLTTALTMPAPARLGAFLPRTPRLLELPPPSSPPLPPLLLPPLLLEFFSSLL